MSAHGDSSLPPTSMQNPANLIGPMEKVGQIENVR
jgi:hypothetical protein